MANSETLFFFDDDEPQVFEFDIRRQEAVRPDYDINGAVAYA